MSNNGHLSASQRKMLALEAHIQQLETSRAEYSLVLNYLLWQNKGSFTVDKSAMKDMMAAQHSQLRVIKSTICDVTGDMTWTYGDEPPKEPNKIISLSP